MTIKDSWMYLQGRVVYPLVSPVMSVHPKWYNSYYHLCGSCGTLPELFRPHSALWRALWLWHQCLRSRLTHLLTSFQTCARLLSMIIWCRNTSFPLNFTWNISLYRSSHYTKLNGLNRLHGVNRYTTHTVTQQTQIETCHCWAHH